MHYIENHHGRIGAVMMEIWRYQDPNLDFIHHVKTRCREEGIVLIFDEISSGFRLNTGGSHQLWDLEPDICVLGKALGNGHPIGAVIGSKGVMDAAQSSIHQQQLPDRTCHMASLKAWKFSSATMLLRPQLSGVNIKTGQKH